MRGANDSEPDAAAPDPTDRNSVAAQRRALAKVRAELARAGLDIADNRERRADDVEAELRLLMEQTEKALDLNAQARRTNTSDRARHRERIELSSNWQAPEVAADDWEATKADFVADDHQLQSDREEELSNARETLADAREELLRVLGDSSDRMRDGALESDDDRSARHDARAARSTAATARTVADQHRRTHTNALAAELVEISRVLFRADNVKDALGHVAEAARRAIDGSDSSSITARVDDEFATLAATSDLANSHDQVQYRVQEGPCLEAIASVQLVSAPDIHADERWPTFVEEITGMQAGSVLSAPLASGWETEAEAGGALNNYSLEVGGFSDGDGESASLLAAHIGVLLGLSQSVEARVGELSKAIETRDVIGQAKGILMERNRLTADQAFDVLRRASQRLNRKLRDLADELATTGTLD